MEKEDEARSNNIQENSVKRYKGSSIQTSQNNLQDINDWISRLPDSLLLHILSQLEIEEVVRTSLLSKRWRYLWTSFPRLDFRFLKSGRKCGKKTFIDRKTAFIDRFLFHHNDSKVDEVHIQIKYAQEDAELVDSWIYFAIKHKVEELELDLFDGGPPEFLGSNYILYKLPHSLLRCGSLTSLELSGCDLNLPTTIQLNSLKTLYLKYMDLDPVVIEQITSNCPLLEDLHLIGCNDWIDLNICITNDNIKNLMITEDWEVGFGNNITTINAPNLISLKSYGRLPRREYHFQEMRSLVNVYFDGHNDMVDVLYGEDTSYDLTLVLHDLRRVKDFTFSSWCLQALTAKEIRGLDPVTINATCIQIQSGLTKWELPGIAYLLKSAIYLERLEILPYLFVPEPELCDGFLEEYDFEEKDFWKLHEFDSSILQYTKTIEIKRFHSTIHVKDVKHWEKEIELVRFLLKTSNVLERMTIEACISSSKNAELMGEVTRKLTSFPRASPNAGLFIT